MCVWVNGEKIVVLVWFGDIYLSCRSGLLRICFSVCDKE